MKFSIWLPTGVLHDFSGYADPVQAYEALAELAYAADDPHLTRCGRPIISSRTRLHRTLSSRAGRR
jgi:hypothetical protein